MKVVGILDSSLEPGYEVGVGKMRKYRNDFFMNQGIKLVVISIDSFDIDKGVFTCYKSQQGNFEIIEEEIMPEVVWVRTSKDYIWYLTLLEGNTIIFPSSLIIKLSNDKRNTYRYLHEFQPKTILLKEALNNGSVLDDMGEKCILKPRKGYGGDGIRMIHKNELGTLNTNIDNSKYIVQRICNFGGGYEGIVSGNHDLRLVYIGGELSYSEVRTNDNDFRVNVSQGGKAVFVDINDIPISLKRVANKCVEKLGGVKSGLIGVDFGYDSTDEKWILIEVNYSPGFTNDELINNKDSIDVAFGAYSKYFNTILT